MGCEDGWIDRFDEDPLWYDENQPERCEDCHGTGIERWCPKCGFDLQKPREKDSNWPDRDMLGVFDEPA